MRRFAAAAFTHSLDEDDHIVLRELGEEGELQRVLRLSRAFSSDPALPRLRPFHSSTVRDGRSRDHRERRDDAFPSSVAGRGVLDRPRTRRVEPEQAQPTVCRRLDFV